MNSASVLSLVSQARLRFDQRNSPTFSDSIELIPWTRDSLKQIHEIVTQAWRDWHTIRRPMSLSGGVERYTLPSDCRALIAVYGIYGANTAPGGAYKQLLHEFPRSEWGINNFFNAYGAPPRYRMQGVNLYVRPVPGADYRNALELQYVPQFRGPLLDWVPIDNVLPNGWEEWVLLDVTIKMAVKMKMDTNDLMRQQQAVEKRVVQGAASRSAEPPKKKDVYSQPRNIFSSGTLGVATWAQ